MITKGKPDKLDFFVINKFSSIGINKKMNSQFRGWENIVLKHKLDSTGNIYNLRKESKNKLLERENN